MSERTLAETMGIALDHALSLYLGDMHDVQRISTDWQSATIVGARHEMRFRTKALAEIVSVLADADLPLSCGFVADLVVVAQSASGDDMIVSLEALTMAD